MSTTTDLIHRPYAGPRDWWREEVLYEVASWEIDNSALQQIQEGLLSHVSSLGFGAVVLRPALVPIESEPEIFRAFAAAAHERGLRVIVRISGALAPTSGPQAVRNPQIFVGLERAGEDLVKRAEAFLEAGADGVDLGAIAPPEIADETDLDLLSDYLTRLQGLVLQYCEDGMVAAAVSGDFPDALQRHFQEDWLHHLCDDELSTVSWRSASLRRHLTRSFNVHDRFGAAPVWRILPYIKLRGLSSLGGECAWYSVEPEQRVSRARALSLLSLALPGAVYIRQADELGTPDEQKPGTPMELTAFVSELSEREGTPEKVSAANIRYAMQLREQYGLAGAAFAVVEGLDWCPAEAFTFLARNVLVLLNTGETSLRLPHGAQVLLASQPLRREGDTLIVSPDTCIWVESASV